MKQCISTRARPHTQLRILVDLHEQIQGKDENARLGNGTEVNGSQG